MKNVDQRIIDYAKTCKNGAMTTKGFKESIDAMALSAKAGKAVLQALATIGNMALMYGATKLVGAFIGFIDGLHTTLKDSVEKDMTRIYFRNCRTYKFYQHRLLHQQHRKQQSLLPYCQR